MTSAISSLPHCSNETYILLVMLLNRFWGWLTRPSFFGSYITYVPEDIIPLYLHKEKSEEADIPPRWALNFRSGFEDYVHWQVCTAQTNA